MATVSVRIDPDSGYPNYTIAIFTVAGDDVPNYGQIRALPSSYTISQIDQSYLRADPPAGGRSTSETITLFVPALVSEINFSSATDSVSYRSVQLWGWNSSANTWQKLGDAVNVYPGYAWLSRATCSTVPGEEEHQIQVTGYTRAWIPKEGDTYHPERGECWFQNIGFAEAQYVEKSDGSLNTTLPASSIKGSTKTGFEIERTADGDYAKLSTIATGLPHLTKLYVYGQGKDGVWYLLNSQFVPSTTAYNKAHALNATTLGVVTYDYNNGSGSKPRQQFSPGNVTLNSYSPSKSNSYQYTVTFDPNGGSVSPTSKKATRTVSYEFTGWNTKSDGTGTSYVGGQIYNLQQDLYLYAQYRKTGDSTGSIALPTPTRSGATFQGWYTAGGSFVGKGGASYTPSSNITLYANWTSTITFDDNGGSGGPGSIDHGPDDGDTMKIPSTTPSKYVVLTYNTNVSRDDGTAVAATATPATKNVYLTFIGWSTTRKTHGSTADYYPGDDYPVNGDATLYAVWEEVEIGDLPVYSNSSSVSPRIYRNSNGAEYRLDSSTPWTTTSTGSTSVSSSTKIYSNTTIYAQWEYRVILYLEGGKAFIHGADPEDEGSITSGPIYKWKSWGSTYTSPYDYGKIGSTMDGFATSSGGSVSYTPKVNYSRNAPIKLYAVWSPERYTVTFHDGFSPKGQDIISVTTVEYGGSVPDQDIPVVGQTYGAPYNKRFQKPGLAQFSRWVGAYRNITSNSDVIALWDFTPVWICVPNGSSRKWVKYEPGED